MPAQCSCKAKFLSKLIWSEEKLAGGSHIFFLANLGENFTDLIHVHCSSFGSREGKLAPLSNATQGVEGHNLVCACCVVDVNIDVVVDVAFNVGVDVDCLC